MQVLKIHGGNPLEGHIAACAAKNSVLPLMAASLLTDEPVSIENCPVITDVDAMVSVLACLGAVCSRQNGSLNICADRMERTEAPYEYVQRMRASVLVLGPLLARCGRASVPLPGGCAIGSRPIDLHIKGLKAMGAKFQLLHGSVTGTAQRLHGASVYLDFPSVGATENLMLAAALAEGITTIRNAAEEPEIADLASMLNAMGAKVHGAGTDTIRIEGVERLRGVKHQPIPDRIEAGTYLIAATASGGDITVENIIPSHLSPLTAKLEEAGAKVTENETSIRVVSSGRLKEFSIKAMPFPGFPTDLQAQMTALACIAKGTSVISETVFDSRFNHVSELVRMGASIRIEDHTALVNGGELLAARVNACDLRAGAALAIAALSAKGTTEIINADCIDRGYEQFEERIRSLGGQIERINH